MSMAEQVNFLIRMVALIGFVVMAILLNNAFYAEINTQSMEKVAAESANLMLQSNLTASRGVFDLDLIKKMDGSDEELVRPCSMAARYGFYLLNESGYEENWSFGFLSDKTFENIENSESTFVGRYGVWLKSGETLLPAEMRVVIFDYALSRFTCDAEKALIAKEVVTRILCQGVGRGISGVSEPRAGNECELYGEDGRICMRAMIITSRGSIDFFTSCRKTEAELVYSRENPFKFGERVEYVAGDATETVRKVNSQDVADKKVEIIKNRPS
ncbi:MAG: hypothetical protein HYW25_00705 [Candidatus Aenigmarchaeota archaeon]|nr:hypothetical protein [Candidatus Aenigmarchaeota archaeon]